MYYIYTALISNWLKKVIRRQLATNCCTRLRVLVFQVHVRGGHVRQWSDFEFLLLKQSQIRIEYCSMQFLIVSIKRAKTERQESHDPPPQKSYSTNEFDNFLSRGWQSWCRLLRCFAIRPLIFFPGESNWRGREQREGERPLENDSGTCAELEWFGL